MDRVRIVSLAGAALWAHPAIAADALKFGLPPAWVHVQPIPAAKPTDAPVAVLLNDQQIALDGPKITTYTELVFKIQNSQGLAAGNVSFAWDPATDAVTVNKLHIIRGGKIIDVLASGQTFTVLRRETNLEAAVLDGTLTANIQPEGLQEGDIVDLATTTEHSDPVLKGHVEATFAGWNGVPIQAGHIMLSWPDGVKISVRETPGLPALQHVVRNGRTTAEMSATGIEPLIAPKGAPTRFTIGRLGEATDFSSWSDVAALMLPLYRSASAIPATGPLRDEVEKIRSASNDEKMRAQRALALVQNRIRYVALLIGQGGFVPASAEQTWSRRFGDCKAKSTLLLGLLRELGVKAEPVLVNSTIGDALAGRLPMLGLFDHVLVRAHIGGKDYWLDGTRTGDTDLDSIEVPNFGWGLPLIPQTQLVHMVPLPLDVPQTETRLEIDASAGIYAPSPASAHQTLHGDLAVGLHSALSSLTDAQRQAFFQTYWNKTFDFISFKTGSGTFDKAKRELRMIMTGEAKMDWTGGYFHVPNSSLGYDPDFDRPAGPSHDAPVAVAYPAYSRSIITLRMPPSFLAHRDFGSVDVHETLAGIEYKRTAKLNGDVLTVATSEKSVLPEVSYKDALAAEPRLRSLDDEDVQLPLTSRYRATEADVAAELAEKPSSADEYFERGRILSNAGKFDEAVADFTAALEAKPKDEWSLANRGLMYVWKRNFAAAEKDLSAAESIDPTNPVLLRARGLMAEFKDECDKAVDFYTRSLAKEPGNSFAIGHRATCEADLSKYDSALADAAEALEADPSWIDLRILRANIFMRQGNHERVAAEAEALTRENPQSDYAWVGAAMTYSALGQRDRAMQAFDRALAIKPQAFIYINRSRARLRSDVAGRLADLDAALKLEPANSDALAAKADLLSERGQYKAALALLEQVKAADDDQYTRQRRAILLYKLGRQTEAEKLFRSIHNGAKAASEFNSLCWAKATAGILLDSALQDCREALEMRPNAGSYLDSLGMVLLKLGKLDDALDAYNQAILEKTGANSLMGRAFVYLKKGDAAHARADANAARKLYPSIDDDFAEYGLKFDDQPSATASSAKQASTKN